jgi:predicted lipoprotein with Yx(FWY)xxD motif
VVARSQRPTPPRQAAPGATVTVQSTGGYGDVLAGPEGEYLFTEDKGSTLTCYDCCAKTWSPLTVEDAPAAGDGVTAELATTEREDGSTQVTAAGNPPHYYADDSDPGDTTGQNLGGVWFLVAPGGTAIRNTATNETTTEDDYYY